MKNKTSIIILLLVLFVMAGCGNKEVAIGEGDLNETPAEEAIIEREIPEEAQEPIPIDPKELIDLSLMPNELGKIMVLMYHNIDEVEQDWVRTPDNFRKDLNNLYEQGYRPLSLTDFATGNITTEQGYTPVIITFDDAQENNMRYLEDGTVDPDCAVGILVAFHEMHPDFPLEVTFFADGPSAFGSSDEEIAKINYIIEQGMDIGNHTQNHVNFKDADAEKIQKEIGGQAQNLESLIDAETYKVNTLALPYGSRPRADELEIYLQKGSYEGVSYENLAILNVGSNPAYSPFDERFDALHLPRVRASEMNVDNVGMYSYLEYFINHPEAKFISDGNAQIITVPEGSENVVSNGKEIYFYEPEVSSEE
ncbi:polysaccharide deacetylase family protein [Clostridia bacterium]|nr:polysaccharide deacetylase family protein [Clostridia bacterium]